MGGATKSVRYNRHYFEAARLALAIAGSLIALMGAIVAIGASFSTSDASTFGILAGFGLIASGVLLAKRHIAGAWTYMAVFAGTLTWSLHAFPAGSASLPYRLVGPLIMLAMIAALMPALRRWGRARTIRVCAALMIGTVATGIMVDASGGPISPHHQAS